jgi:hypothetical protein
MYETYSFLAAATAFRSASSFCTCSKLVPKTFSNSWNKILRMPLPIRTAWCGYGRDEYSVLTLGTLEFGDWDDLPDRFIWIGHNLTDC